MDFGPKYNPNPGEIVSRHSSTIWRDVRESIMAATDRIATPIELDPVLLQSGPGQEQDADDAGLCERCRHFDIQAFARSDNRTRGYMLRDVEFAATHAGDDGVTVGCAFCSLLLSSVKDVERPKDSTEWELNVFRFPIDNDPSMYVHMTVHNTEPTTRSPTPGLRANRLRAAIADRFSEVMNVSGYELCLVADSESPAARRNDITGRYLGSDPGSDAHFDTIQAWIRDCESHPRCKQTVSGRAIDAYQAELPARCIELSARGSDIVARVISTEGMRGSYITLTHRWNLETERCKTTAANCDQRQRGLDLRHLPRLFTDVFAIAARLGVGYIWIDSLCIIQDGDGGADWKKEAPRMAQYYQHSLFTVAGTMEDMDNGLLQPYSEDDSPWGHGMLVRLPYRDRTSEQAGHFFVYRRQVPVVNDYWATVRESILFRRGWILQEWLLSKRLLWYTPKGLFFECYTDGPRTEYQERVLVENAQSDLRAQLQLKGSFAPDNIGILDFWYRTIELYSSCNLTKPDKDRILAVAGLSKEVGPILADRMRETAVDGVHHETYLAGLWLRDLHHGLLWEEDHSALPWTIAVDEAPTWSWASLMMLVRWPDKDNEAQKALQVIGLCQTRQDGVHHRPEYTIERGRWAVQRPHGHTAARRAPFDPTNMFACLHIRGRLSTVHVRGYLGTEGNTRAATATAYSTRPPSDQWRALCSPTRPEVIAGWASAERLRTNEGDAICADAGTAVQVLHVSTRFVRSGFLLKRKDRVLDVLLVEEIDATNYVFRRLGVGRIFDRDLITELEKAKECVIQFV
ncbi:uncharacterized protein B0H64DRAFT_376637 [Chaetomium fimeti]|uniref:Heterokaryon incompatibility domain-containing protein n=1 Tax=Chaetomium fimeti TaxID=1854472 RepID=A0AAE0HC41_9PEZI|nr:hypothetical protein B0H64DRAFT_376637 [Chaetomium fimeti]